MYGHKRTQYEMHFWVFVSCGIAACIFLPCSNASIPHDVRRPSARHTVDKLWVTFLHLSTSGYLFRVSVCRQYCYCCDVKLVQGAAVPEHRQSRSLRGFEIERVVFKNLEQPLDASRAASRGRQVGGASNRIQQTMSQIRHWLDF